MHIVRGLLLIYALTPWWTAWMLSQVTLASSVSIWMPKSCRSSRMYGSVKRVFSHFLDA